MRLIKKYRLPIVSSLHDMNRYSGEKKSWFSGHLKATVSKEKRYSTTNLSLKGSDPNGTDLSAND